VVNLTSIFGPYLTVTKGGRIVQRRYTGWPGGDGVTAMHLGARGYSFTIRGRIAASGATYAIARAACDAAFGAMQNYLWSEPADYYHEGLTLLGAVFDRIEPVPIDGRQYLPVSGGCAMHFEVSGRALR